MAKEFTGAQKKIVDRYYDNIDTIMLDKLGHVVSEIYLSDSEKKAEKLWQSAAKALEKVAANNAAARKVLADKNVEGLASLIGELNVADKSKKSAASTSESSASSGAVPASPVAPPAAVASETAAPAAPEAPSAEQLKMAMRAFRKRLKLTKLDAESSIGRSPLTGGHSSGLVAIVAPRDYPLAVWEALADEGKLKRAGRGFYQLGPKA